MVRKSGTRLKRASMTVATPADVVHVLRRTRDSEVDARVDVPTEDRPVAPVGFLTKSARPRWLRVFSDVTSSSSTQNAFLTRPPPKLLFRC